MAGIVCKVWNIQGTVASKSTGSQLKDSISYILNEEKTDVTLNINLNETESQAQLLRECIYVEDDIKTLEGAFIGCLNLKSAKIEEAVEEMMQTKELWGKTGGRAALHGVISLPESDSKIENAGKLLSLCRDTLSELFPDNQAIFGVHTNTENLHVHFIVNSVSLKGKKIHMAKDFTSRKLQPAVNKYALQYDFPINDKWVDEQETEFTKTAWSYIQLRNLIDEAIANEDSYEGFIKEIEMTGAKVEDKVALYIQTEGMDWPLNTAKLGGNYSRERILERIETKRDELRILDDSWIKYKKEEPADKALFSPLKRYKDLSDKQKKYVRDQLAKGRNPWRLRYETSKMIERVSKESESKLAVYRLVKNYSADGSFEGALEAILEEKKSIQERKKAVYKELQFQKPVIDIYKAMQSIESRAFLCEEFSEKSYAEELAEYKRLTEKLKDCYSKDIRQVGEYYDSCQQQIAYANAQLKELSLEYREILASAREMKILYDDKLFEQQEDVVKKQ